MTEQLPSQPQPQPQPQHKHKYLLNYTPSKNGSGITERAIAFEQLMFNDSFDENEPVTTGELFNKAHFGQLKTISENDSGHQSFFKSSEKSASSGISTRPLADTTNLQQTVPKVEKQSDSGRTLLKQKKDDQKSNHCENESEIESNLSFQAHQAYNTAFQIWKQPNVHFLNQKHNWVCFAVYLPYLSFADIRVDHLSNGNVNINVNAIPGNFLPSNLVRFSKDFPALPNFVCDLELASSVPLLLPKESVHCSYDENQATLNILCENIVLKGNVSNVSESLKSHNLCPSNNSPKEDREPGSRDVQTPGSNRLAKILRFFHIEGKKPMKT